MKAVDRITGAAATPKPPAAALPVRPTRRPARAAKSGGITAKLVVTPNRAVAFLGDLIERAERARLAGGKVPPLPATPPAPRTQKGKAK